MIADLPYRDGPSTGRFEDVAHAPDDGPARVLSRHVVQNRETDDGVETPLEPGQFVSDDIEALEDEALREIAARPPGREESVCVVDPEIGAVPFSPGHSQRPLAPRETQAAVAATDVEHRVDRVESSEDLHDPVVQAASGRRELPGKRVVELPIELDEARDDGRIHDLLAILSGMGHPHDASTTDLEALSAMLGPALDRIAALENVEPDDLVKVLRRHPRPDGGLYRKSELVAAYQYQVRTQERPADDRLLQRIRMKPVRTLSGVTPVTVLTKPWPCPGKCIFCPTDVRMPKSYLHDEPGAMRAEQHGFDPHEQVRSRIDAFEANGHSAEKIELLVLGGTWSSYPRDYQERFLRRCFDAMNERASNSMAEAHAWNETTRRRNVGMVLETRPDHVDADEIRWLRSLGCTKIQMGAQSLDDRVLRMNKRGHTVQQMRDAMIRLRAAGFKLVLHWMPNLHGATIEGDREDFARLWSDDALRPDEIKIYSTQLLENAELYEVWERGEYTPYDEADLIDLILDCKEMVPEYCRINRVYRDIPGDNVVEGTRLTNMRQVIQDRMRREGRACRCIRCREVKGQSPETVVENARVYRTTCSEEHFLSFETPDDRLAGYLRLSLPERPGEALGESLGMKALEGAAIVREVHVVGPAQELGQRDGARAQHRGLGRRLLERAEAIARDAGFERMAIIASVGTRDYYRARGYELDDTYMTRRLDSASA